MGGIEFLACAAPRRNVLHAFHTLGKKIAVSAGRNIVLLDYFDLQRPRMTDGNGDDGWLGRPR